MQISYHMLYLGTAVSDGSLIKRTRRQIQYTWLHEVCDFGIRNPFDSDGLVLEMKRRWCFIPSVRNKKYVKTNILYGFQHFS